MFLIFFAKIKAFVFITLFDYKKECVAQIQFSLIKKIGRPEHTRYTPTPIRPITSQFCLTLPPLFKLDVIYVSPLKEINSHKHA